MSIWWHLDCFNEDLCNDFFFLICLAKKRKQLFWTDTLSCVICYIFLDVRVRLPFGWESGPNTHRRWWFNVKAEQGQFTVKGNLETQRKLFPKNFKGQFQAHVFFFLIVWSLMHNSLIHILTKITFISWHNFVLCGSAYAQRHWASHLIGPVAPHLLKVFPTLGPYLHNIINSSLSSGVVPLNFKHALVQPLF